VDFETFYKQIDDAAGDRFLDTVETGLEQYGLSLPYSVAWLVWSIAMIVFTEVENVLYYVDQIMPDWMPSTWYLLAMMPIYWLVNLWDPTHARLARRSVACQVLSVAYRGARRVACVVALAFVALAGAASAQITCTDKPVRVLSGVGESVVTGDYLILPDGAPGNILKATQVSLGGCDGWLVAAKASDSKRNPVAVSEIAPCNYLVMSNQPVWLSVTAIDFANQGFDTAEFLLNPDAPEPEPDDPDDPDVPDDPDEPDVPSDQFDNLGRRIAALSASAPKRHDVGMVYVDVSKRLSSGQIISINDAAAEVVRRASSMLGETDKDRWKQITEAIQTDLNSRWPMGRKTYSEWLLAIAAGLGVQP
jgi:hypothetical protein